jgi:hypothetical protein
MGGSQSESPTLPPSIAGNIGVSAAFELMVCPSHWLTRVVQHNLLVCLFASMERHDFSPHLRILFLDTCYSRMLVLTMRPCGNNSSAVVSVEASCL